jgi:UDP-N-acetylglucosamine 2-epimerase (non-hydrolysing)
MVAAARPNFMKIGPLVTALEGRADIELVHTGQHYDHAMSQAMFNDLGLPQPEINLGVGSGTHSEQTARVMIAYERHLSGHPPDAIVVVGDVNSTLAAALVAAKLGIPIAHVEAGLRSCDWSMPEEINRVLVDRLATWLFTPDQEADANLVAEGIEKTRIHRVGNVMIDTLNRNLPAARAGFPRLREKLGLPSRYGVMTLHRPNNVDSPAALQRILGAVARLSRDIDIVFPVHPRTKHQILGIALDDQARIRFLEPLGYNEFLGLMDGSALVLTDSGGIQEETSVLGVPCLTLRETTERPITCRLGTNKVVGTDPEAILLAASEALNEERREVSIPLWDGKSADRIASILLVELEKRLAAAAESTATKPGSD